ncbi:DUF308 domain-containing protein [Georgenia sp. AZ-5]|uniref:DUF308 domain-containing protein n=1 Tax=Georgenia sp. AZ-5 TaxID=3367526 RepID=UPI003754F37A
MAWSDPRARLVADLRRFAARTWRHTVFRGVLAFVLGVVLLLAPLSSVVAVVAVLGAVVVLDGAVAVVVGLRARHVPGWGWWLGQGLASVLVGLLLLWQPELMLATLVVLGGVAALVAGVVVVAVALQTRGVAGRSWRGEVTVGALLAVLGVVLMAFPTATVATAAVTAGLLACVGGAALLVRGARLRRAARALDRS